MYAPLGIYWQASRAVEKERYERKERRQMRLVCCTMSMAEKLIRAGWLVIVEVQDKVNEWLFVDRLVDQVKVNDSSETRNAFWTYGGSITTVESRKVEMLRISKEYCTSLDWRRV